MNTTISGYHLSLPPLIVPSCSPSSASTNDANLVFFNGVSPSSSPKRNAAFSRPGPDAGRLPDLRNGDNDLGGDDLSDVVGVVLPGSSIHENEDCAIVDRVGTGALGRATRPSASVWGLSAEDSESNVEAIVGESSIVCFCIFGAGSRIGVDGSGGSMAVPGVFFLSESAWGLGERLGEELRGGACAKTAEAATTGVISRGATSSSDGSDGRGIVESSR